LSSIALRIEEIEILEEKALRCECELKEEELGKK
jgi:hypothetical protein